MFKLTRPCSDCPFRKGMGSQFQLHPRRLAAIVEGMAFQCHKTVDYSGKTGLPFDHGAEDEDRPSAGDHPQQCAGLMALLHREGQPNQIMRIGERLGHLDCSKLDPDSDTYASIAEAKRAHRGKEPKICG